MEQRKARMKDFLAESLVVLMQEKPFEKITIKQICDRTGVIRATFYNHFEDKYAALDYVCGMMLCEKRQALIAAGEMESYIRSLCIEIYDHAGFFRKAFQVRGQNDFDTMFLTHAAGASAHPGSGGQMGGGRMTARSCRCITPMPSCICARNGCARDA